MKIALFPPAFSSPEMQDWVDYAKKGADEAVVNPYGRLLKTDETLVLWNDVDVIVAGGEEYSAEMFTHAPKKLKAIVRWGVGYDRVDLPSAKAHGIRVAALKGCNSNAVAEYAISAMFSSARLIPQHDAIMRKNGWKYFMGTELEGKVLGILGMGAIGKLVAKKAIGLGLHVLAYDPYFDESFAEKFGIKKVTFDEVIAQSDFVSLHLPATEQTKGIINKAVLGRMKSTAILINSARGSLVDEPALIDALENHVIRGAALDVFSQERCFGTPLAKLSNVVLSPHMASITQEATNFMSKLAIDVAFSLYRGEDSPYLLT